MDARTRTARICQRRAKLHYLPQIARGEIRWCQGYSEPGSGSDLAGLQTKAEDQELLSSQWLQDMDFIRGRGRLDFCLVRTDGEAAKHDGISFLLFDMESEGVTTSPIKLVSGSSPFCQTFSTMSKYPKLTLSAN